MLHELLANVVRTGEAFWAKDLLFEVERYGFLEETYFDVSYDPVRVESGEVGGVNCIVAETTERVVGVRRMALLKDLAEPARSLHHRHRDSRREAARRDVRSGLSRHRAPELDARSRREARVLAG
jgi:hypothetical protein